MLRIKAGSVLCLAFLAAALPAHAEGDAIAGKAVFRKCAPCHSMEPTNRVGPTLAGILGRPVAAVEGYRYSAAMTAFADGGKVWNEGLIGEYLVSPKALVPGTSMAFAGLKKPADIADLIAYLKKPGSD